MIFYDDGTFDFYKVEKNGKNIEYVAWHKDDETRSVLAKRNIATNKVTYTNNYSGYFQYYIRRRLMEDKYIGKTYTSHALDEEATDFDLDQDQ